MGYPMGQGFVTQPGSRGPGPSATGVPAFDYHTHGLPPGQYYSAIEYPNVPFRANQREGEQVQLIHATVFSFWVLRLFFGIPSTGRQRYYGASSQWYRH